MPIELHEENGGKILAIHTIGKLVDADYKTFVPEFGRLSGHGGRLRVLFDMTGLRGWDAHAAWDDLKFDIKHFGKIERLAIIGTKPWQHGMATLFAPFTKATTKYFDHAEAAEARKWLAEG